MEKDCCYLFKAQVGGVFLKYTAQNQHPLHLQIQYKIIIYIFLIVKNNSGENILVYLSHEQTENAVLEIY